MSSNTAEYFATVTAIADDLIDLCRQGDIRDLPGAIHEAVDGNHYVIYTHANFEVRAASDSWGACEDEIGWDELVSSASSFDQLASVYAYHAMVADVRDELASRGDFDPDNEETWPIHFDPGTGAEETPCGQDFTAIASDTDRANVTCSACLMCDGDTDE